MSKSQREIDREVRNLEKGEKKLEKDIRAQAKAGRTANARVLAKDLVRVRAQTGKLHQTKTQMNSIGMKVESIKYQGTMMDAMKKGSEVMGAMNAQMNPMEAQAMAQKFAAESEKASMMSETFDEMFDSMMDDDEEQETDALVDQIFTELALDGTKDLNVVQGGKVVQQVEVAPEPEPEAVDSLQARLKALQT